MAPLLLLMLLSANVDETVSYRLGAEPEHGRLLVEMRLQGDADGETRLQLPRQWAGSSDLWRHVSGLEVEGAAAEPAGDGAYLLRHRPGAPLAIRYSLISAWQEDPGLGYEKARPLVRADGLFVHGEGVFASVAGREEAPARFAWGALPPGWTAASDLDHVAAGGGSVRDVIESVAIAGPDLELRSLDAGGGRLRIAMRGRWRFSADELAASVLPVIRAADQYWGEGTRDYLVALAPLGELPGGGLSYTGTGRGDAFSIASTSGFELAGAARFLAHEYLHRWFPDRLGGLPEDRQGRGYWFSEGVNDWLAARLLLRSEIWSLEDYAADLNEVLLRYAASPARGAGADEIAERFWQDNDVMQISYDRGHALAWLADHRLREEGGLDPLLRAQRAAAGGAASADTLFLDLLAARAPDLLPAFRAVAEQGAEARLPETLFPGCARVETRHQPVFDRGFDAAATAAAGNVVAGVDPDGPAHAAGLRDGMRIVRRLRGRTGDSAAELAYLVEADGVEREIAYRPEGHARLRLQRLHLTDEALADRRAECTRLIGG
jgi:predicted metalloprotease with PDZ domain